MDLEPDAVDALFAEAFALLDGRASSSSPSSSSSSTDRRVSLKPAKPRVSSATRLKRAIDALVDEEKQLRDQLTLLRGPHHSLQYHAARERAMAERLKRHRAERECDALRQSVYQQTRFLRGLRGMFSQASPPSLSVNLCHHLHNFTRLPKDSALRLDEFELLMRENRVRVAIDLLKRETEAVSLVDNYVDATFVHAPGEPASITSTSIFILGDYDVPMVLRAACVAIRDIIVRCRSYKWVGVAGEILDADALSQRNLQYRVTNIRRSTDEGGEDFSVESRAVTMYRMVGDCAVVLWDFVDVDELHPLEAAPDITRQSVGACLIRQELCPDGVVRTVYRELSTRRYAYSGGGTPSPSVARYLSTQRLSMQWNELLFREILLEQLAQEPRVLAAPSCLS